MSATYFVSQCSLGSWFARGFSPCDWIMSYTMKHFGRIFQYLKDFVLTMFMYLLFSVNVWFLRLTGMHIHSKWIWEMHVHVTMETESWTQTADLLLGWLCALSSLGMEPVPCELSEQTQSNCSGYGWQKLLCHWSSESKTTLWLGNDLTLQRLKEV